MVDSLVYFFNIGSDTKLFATDSLAFQALFETFLKEIGVNEQEYDKNCVTEILHAGACVLPNIAAIVGGVASQEIIKLITNQYLILDNMVIYDGIKSVFSKYKI